MACATLVTMAPCRPPADRAAEMAGKWADERRPMTAFNEIFVYLLQTFLSLYLVAMLLRFLLQLVRADFYNPISQFLVKITNPLVVPLRKLIPGFGGIDVASLLLALLLQLAGIVALLLAQRPGTARCTNAVVWYGPAWASSGCWSTFISSRCWP